MSARRFAQVDVFGAEPLLGNPVAVVLDAAGLDDATLARVARWTNLSETTFVLPTRDPGADYRVRILTPTGELPFAGHPTLGTAHAWRAAGGVPRAGAGAEIVQECGAGLVRVRSPADGAGFAFAAPPLVRSGPVDASDIAAIAAMLGVERAEIVDGAWVDNGPGWVGVLLRDADAVLALAPSAVTMHVGVAGLWPEGSRGAAEAAVEVRAFVPGAGGAGVVEDPVTGSLGASLAQWLLGCGRLSAPYVAAQGTALGRRGRIHVTRDDDGTIWVAGATRTIVEGVLDL